MTVAERRKAGQGWKQKGVQCPKCACRDSRVYFVKNGRQTIWRTRICRACGERFQTKEEAK